MAISNKDLDVSSQRDMIMWTGGAAGGATYGLGVGVGITLQVSGPMPYPYVLQSANAMAVGTSGAPQLVFSIYRPVQGAAATVIAVSISNMIICNGASFAGFGSSAVNALGYSGFAATGSTLLLGQRGDILLATTAVANTACTNLAITMVVQKVQDVMQYNGV